MNPLFSSFFFTPMAMSEAGAMKVRSIAMDNTIAMPQSKEHTPIDISHDYLLNELPKPYDLDDGTRVIPLDGPISRGLGFVGRYYGFADTDMFVQWVNEAVADEAVTRIALHISSPGGTAIGCEEAAQAVKAAGKRKPTVTFSDGLMASAAYYIGCAAHTIYATPSSIIGSIGTYSVIVDDSEYWLRNGIRFVVIRSGAHKGAGIDGFTEEQLAEMQSFVDSYGTQFRDFVHSARPEISDEIMQGQCFIGKLAERNGMADFVAQNLTAALRHNANLIEL
jgi:ClpP class serine protease